MARLRLSKTLIGQFEDYMLGETCGILFQKQYIHKEVQTDPSPAMKAGQRFEYFAIGSKLRDGSIPEELKTAAGNVSKTEEYRAKIQADNFKKFIKGKDIEIGKVSQTLLLELKNYDAKGITDYTGLLNEKPLIGDLKYTALLGNKWEPHGWHHQKLMYSKHMYQVRMYIFLYYNLYNEIPWFLFHVHSSKNEWEYEAFLIETPDDMIDSICQSWKIKMDAINDSIIYIEKNGLWNPKPSVKNCLRGNDGGKCPWFDNCKFKTEINGFSEFTILE